jgi:hypothetical protein
MKFIIKRVGSVYQVTTTLRDKVCEYMVVTIAEVTSIHEAFILEA